MRHPFEIIPEKAMYMILALACFTSLLIVWQLTIIGYPEVTHSEIVAFEFARTRETAQKIVAAWSNENAINKAIHYQWVDFLFMITYSTTIGLACIQSSRCLFSGSNRLPPIFISKWIDAGIHTAWAQWLAAGFDAVENIALFPFLYGTDRGEIPLAQIAATSASLKFALIAIGALYILTSTGFKVLNLSPKK